MSLSLKRFKHDSSKGSTAPTIHCSGPGSTAPSRARLSRRLLELLGG